MIHSKNTSFAKSFFIYHCECLAFHCRPSTVARTFLLLKLRSRMTPVKWQVFHWILHKVPPLIAFGSTVVENDSEADAFTSMTMMLIRFSECSVVHSSHIDFHKSLVAYAHGDAHSVVVDKNENTQHTRAASAACLFLCGGSMFVIRFMVLKQSNTTTAAATTQ